MSYHTPGPWQVAALVTVSMALSGCGLDVLEGKPSSFQAEQERRDLITLPVVAVAEPVAEPEVEPAPAALPAPEPVCVPVFRVVVCP